LAWLDHGQKPQLEPAKPALVELQTPPVTVGAVPFALATPHQVAAQALAILMQPLGLPGWGAFTHIYLDRPVGGTTPGHPTSDV
jgi:hypothetical protein